MRLFIHFIRKNLEALIWIAALLFLAFTDPSQQHFTICPFHNLGFEHCPGCGIGRSVSWIFHGSFLESLRSHPLGFLATGLLLFRIYELLRKYFSDNYLKNQIN